MHIQLLLLRGGTFKMETEITQERQTKIQKLERDIQEVHVPANRSLVNSILSLMLPASPYVIYPIWRTVSPETYSSGIEDINHFLANFTFIAYNGIKLVTGQFKGCFGKMQNYLDALNELNKVKSELDPKNKTC